MTTTCVRDSIVGDAWIQATAQAVPMQYIIDEKTGQPTGDILTGPVRLAFDTLFNLPQPTPQNQNPKYGSMILFTPYTDLQILYDEYYKECAVAFPEYYDQQTQQYHGLHSPFRNQAEKIKFGGFTPGLTFLNCTSKFKPPVVDARGNAIVDQSKVYPGVWAICSINRYHYKDPRKKGVGFGLQSVMIIGDDTKFGGGAPDTQATFRGVNVSAPIVRPDMARNMPQGQNGQPVPGAAQQIYGGAPAPVAQPYAAPAPSPAPAYAAPAHTPYAAPAQAQPAFAPPSEDYDFLN